MIQDADRLRVAIALTALKLKPPEQSCASYVLDLRSKFPPTIPCAPTSDGSWRTRALDLENELKLLQEKYEAEQIKSIALAKANESAATLVAVAQQTVSEDVESRRDGNDEPRNGTKKKKAKGKKPAVADADAGKVAQTNSIKRLDLEAILQGSNSISRAGRVLTLNTHEESLFASFSSFEQLCSVLPDNLNASQKALLLSTTIRAMEAVSRVLKSTLSPPSALNLEASLQVDSMQTLNVLLTHLLSTTFAMLFPKSTPELQRNQQKSLKKQKKATPKQKPDISGTSDGDAQEDVSAEFWPSFEKLLDNLTTRILQPLLKALVSVSQAQVQSLFEASFGQDRSAGKRSSDSAPASDGSSGFRVSDIRPDMLSLFRNAFCYVSHLVAYPDTPGIDQALVSGVRECLSLTAVRELLKLYDCRDCMDDPQLRDFMFCGDHNFDADHPEGSRFPPIIGVGTTSFNTFPIHAASGVPHTSGSVSSNPSPAHLRAPLHSFGEKAYVGGLADSREKPIKVSNLADAAKSESATRMRRLTRDARIRAIARKDTVWYLCTVLHTLLENASFPTDNFRSSEFALASTSEARSATSERHAERETYNFGYLSSLPSVGIELASQSTYPPSLGSSTSENTHFSLSSRGSENPTRSQKTRLARSTPSFTRQSLSGQHQKTSAETSTYTNSNTSDRYGGLSKAKANTSSSALLRTGLLQSFDELLVLVSDRRPPLTVPCSTAASAHGINYVSVGRPRTNTSRDDGTGKLVSEGIQNRENGLAAGKINDNDKDISTTLDIPNEARAIVECEREPVALSLAGGDTSTRLGYVKDKSNLTSIAKDVMEGFSSASEIQGHTDVNTVEESSIASPAKTAISDAARRRTGIGGNSPRNSFLGEAMGEIEYEMVLGVIERYWECTVGLDSGVNGS
ncbi:hypothetical protein D9757_007274 [Collybiopsis confluens]|uniref:Uncharacterized protein n=1 Tax=Collybiopsis confluens TaxID=2823264 RepID=A0A8H5HGK1_9AGAR|nr:hypothetical protein D9757_007274 [Collybiopsis confluens]